MTAVLDLARAVLDDTRKWGDRANCIGKAAVLENPTRVDEAKALCLGNPATGQTRCPAINDCHAWVIPLRGKTDPGGVRAGRTEEERGDFRRGRASRPRSATEKHCPDCGQTKPGSEFYRHRKHKDGLASYCKPCDLARQAAFRARKETAA